MEVLREVAPGSSQVKTQSLSPSGSKRNDTRCTGSWILSVTSSVMRARYQLSYPRVAYSWHANAFVRRPAGR